MFYPRLKSVGRPVSPRIPIPRTFAAYEALRGPICVLSRQRATRCALSLKNALRRLQAFLFRMHDWLPKRSSFDDLFAMIGLSSAAKVCTIMAFTVICKDCGHRAVITKTNRKHPELYDIYCACKNPHCGHAFVAQFTFSHSIRTSAQAKEDLFQHVVNSVPSSNLDEIIGLLQARKHETA